MFLFLIAASLIFVVATEKRLIRTSDTDAKWMTEDEILGIIQKKIRFMDVTDFHHDFRPPNQGILLFT